MTFSLSDVDARTALLRGFEGVDLACVPRTELVKLLKAAGDAKGAMDRVIAVVAGEVQRRSSAEDGAGGLARVEGYGSAPQMVASLIGATPSEGHQLVRAGSAMSEDRPLKAALEGGL
ncbi:hypothetical protein, partial [Demequina sp.]|uniref:hypothetical protein n=1 Tax=Demequina sp. TaxID=2050685 RepID=UPI003D0E090C